MERPNISRFPLLQPVDGVDAAVGGVVDAGAVVLDERQVGRDVASRERREASVNLKWDNTKNGIRGKIQNLTKSFKDYLGTRLVLGYPLVS